MPIILIVEDEEAVRQLLTTILTPEYQVVQATNTTQAIASARLNRPDMVLLGLDLQGHPMAWTCAELFAVNLIHLWPKCRL